MVVSNSWIIEDDSVFRKNLENVLGESYTIWDWDCHEDCLGLIVKKEERYECAVLAGDGSLQYIISEQTLPKGVSKIRLTRDSLFFSSPDGLTRFDRTTGKQKVFDFSNGINAFEVDKAKRVWFLYGGYSEMDNCVIYNFAADQKLGSMSLDHLTAALAVHPAIKASMLHEEEIRFSRFSKMTRTFDDAVAVYDPKQDAVFDSETRKKIVIDHSSPGPSDTIICLRDWIVLYKHTRVPHDNSSFAEFSVYARRQGWNEYSANAERTFCSKKFENASFHTIRVMDADSFILETGIQKRLSKFSLRNRLSLPASAVGNTKRAAFETSTMRASLTE